MCMKVSSIVKWKKKIFLWGRGVEFLKKFKNLKKFVCTTYTLFRDL